MLRFVKSIITIAAMIVVLSFNHAEARDTKVRGYIRKDGSYVQPHGRSNPNRSAFDNYSTKGNSSPYTGNRGTADPYQPMPSNSTRRGYNR